MPEQPAGEDCVALILAAGFSGRMGRPKTDLPWLGGQALLPWMMQALFSAGWSPRAVLSPAGHARWGDKLPVGSAILNPHPEQGKTTSLIAGLKGLPAAARWILLTAIDQPRPPALYRRLREEVETATQRIVVPDYLGHRGHPLLMEGSLREEILGAEEASFGLRGVLDAHREETLSLAGFDPAWLCWDLNTPAEYEEALAFFSALPA